MSKTVLELVQSILEKTDDAEVNSISDAIQGLNAAGCIETVFNSIMSERDVPEHQELMKLSALNDSAFPTHFEYPSSVKHLFKVWYNVSDDGGNEYREITWAEPLDFIAMTDNQTSNVTNVYDKNGSTLLFIRNDTMPTCYTSFDDKHIVFDSYDNTVDSTLQESKTRAIGIRYPSFVLSDTHVIDLDDGLTNFLLLESLALYQDLYKGGVTPKVNQLSNRSRIRVPDDRTATRTKRNNFGRRNRRIS